jgi:hypothetical protein
MALITQTANTQTHINKYFVTIAAVNGYIIAEYRITKPYIKIVCRPDGRLTGEAYIRFDTMAGAQEALKLDKKEIGKRYVELFVVDPTEADNVMSI